MPIGPGNAPEKYVTMYDRNEVPIPPNAVIDGKTAYSERWFKIYIIASYFWEVCQGRRPEGPADRLPEGMDLRDLIAWYYGMVTCVDDCVGRLMSALAARGLANTTIVVFTSDHGDMLGSHGRFNKATLFEEAIRIPLIFHWPAGLAPRDNRDQIAQIIDVPTTLLSLAGLEAPPHMQGRDLAPLLRGRRRTLDANDAIIEARGHLGIRTTTHLYGRRFLEPARWLTDEDICLYDLSADPQQMNNLAGSPAAADVEARLAARLEAWDAATPWLPAGDP